MRRFWILTACMALLASSAKAQWWNCPWGCGPDSREVVVIGSGNASSYPTTGTNLIVLPNGTAPSGMATDTAGIFADGTTPTELWVIDEAGNKTQLSSHSFTLFEPDPAEPYPWTFHARNDHIGKEIEVDMAKLARLVERLTGAKLIHVRDVPRRAWVSPDPMPGWMERRAKER